MAVTAARPRPPVLTTDVASDAAASEAAVGDTLSRGYKWLQFPWLLEQRYQNETSAARLTNLRASGWIAITMAQAFVLGDWWMVSDQLGFGLAIRLVLLLPMIICWMAYMPRWTPALRERGLLMLSWVLGLILVTQVVRSQAPFAPAYLVALSMIVLLNGGMLRVRFWNALVIDLGLLAMYMAAVLMLPHASVSLMTSILITLVATAVFTLWGAYRMEHSARTFWLKSQLDSQLERQLQTSITRFESLSRFDALTGLPNRRQAQWQLQQMWARARHDGAPITVLLMDVDHFKKYNDHHGHPAGDACLQRVAGALSGALQGPKAFVARWGGEEFLAVLAGHAPQQVAAHAQAALRAVEALRIAHGASPTAPVVTMSLGAATARAPAADVGAASLIQAADEALYRAKASGRNQSALTSEEACDASAQPGRGCADADEQPDFYRQEPHIALDMTAQLARLDRPWALPHFNGPMESAYWHDRATSRFNDFIMTGVIALFVFNLFLPVDYLLARDVWQEALYLRLGVFTPFWALVLLLCWQGKSWVLRHVHPVAHEVLVLSSGVLAGACLSYVLSASHSPLVQYYHVGLMVVMLYGNLVQRLRFWFAVLSSATIVGMHVHGALTAPGIDPRLVVPMIALLTFSGVFSLMANYTIDLDDRRIYLVSQRSKALVKALNDTEEEVRRLAKVDPLTGLYNRRHVDDTLTTLLAGAGQLGPDASGPAGLAAIMIDVDHFKRFNDHHGHPEGDRCLRAVAAALSSCVREPSDFVARGGAKNSCPSCAHRHHRGRGWWPNACAWPSSNWPCPMATRPQRPSSRPAWAWRG